jgi:hypothetical protein
LRRLWLVVTTPWLIYWVWLVLVDCNAKVRWYAPSYYLHYYGRACHFFSSYPSMVGADDSWGFVLWVFRWAVLTPILIPILVLIIGSLALVVGRWVARGFAQKEA